MQRAAALKILNPVLGGLALCQVLSGLLHGFLPRDTFIVLHRTCGLAFAAAAVVHVILNWNWIRATYLTRRPPAGG